MLSTTAFQFHVPRRARAARHLASRGQLRATKPSTTHAVTRRDVIYRAIRRRLTRVACLDTCCFLRRWPRTRRRRRQSRRRLHASSSARPAAPCTTTTTTARRRVRHSTRQLLADTFHRCVSWRHSSEPRSPHSAPLSRLNLRCQLQSIRPGSQRNCKGKTWRCSVILLWRL